METRDSSAGAVVAGEHQRSLELEGSLRDVLRGLGINTSHEHFYDTPRRIAAFWQEFYNPSVDLHDVLQSGFEYDPSATGMVIQTGIPFRMLCAHHFAPATGLAAVGYIPTSRVVGLSKLARLVDATGTRVPSTQEAITDAIANTFDYVMTPKGVIVVTQAEHTCMTARGIKVPGTKTTVSAVRGIMKNPAPRQEFFSLAKI